MIDDIRTLIIDSNRAFLFAARVLIASRTGLKCVGEANSAREGFLRLVSLRPQLILIGDRLADLPALEVVQRIKAISPAPRVIMMTDSRPDGGHPGFTARAPDAVIAKADLVPDLFPLIRSIFHGEAEVA